MKIKKVIKVLLLIFVAVSAGWLIVQQGQGGPNEADASPSPLDGATASAPRPEQSLLPNRIIVYYFHTTYRCPTCHKIENYTKEVIETVFSQALEDGRLEFLVLNVDKPQNAHFIQDYELHTKSVVVADIQDGQQVRWKNLTRIWELIGNRENFFKYVEDEINQYLQGK